MNKVISFKTGYISVFLLMLFKSYLLCEMLCPDDSLQYKGFYLPERGTIRALIIVSQFPDDTISSGAIKNRILPGGYKNIISSENMEVYPEWTLSDYFRKMSNGTTTSGLNVIGDVYDSLVIVPKTMSSYNNLNNNYGDVNRDVLSWIINNTNIDFSKFDNWTLLDEHEHINSSDGIVDMIIIIYRYIDKSLLFGYGNFSGIAQLGEGQPDLYTRDFTKSGKKVFISFRGLISGKASGVTINRSWLDFNVLTHEFCHYLFGPIHHSGSGIMGQYYKPAMSSSEREFLGYMTIKKVIQGELLLSDYLTTNIAFRYTSSNNEKFILENHQKLSVYDGVKGRSDSETKGRGLYIFHQKNDFDTEIECAGGKWNWNLECYFKNIFSPYQTLPMWKRGAPDAFNGKNELEIGKGFDGTCDNPVYTGEDQGDDGNAFSVGYNQVFSPWSNPNNYSENGTFSNFAIELLTQTDSNIKVHIYINDAASSQPSKPLGVRIIYDPGNGTVIKWLPNTEPDIKGYNVWRKEKKSDEDTTKYIKLNKSPIKKNYYIDKSFQSKKNKPNNEGYLVYRISAIDTQNKESVLSDE